MRLRLAFGAITLALLSVIVGCDPSAPPVPECPREDSVGCVWHAERHGNGEGRSFEVDLEGNVRYLP